MSVAAARAPQALRPVTALPFSKRMPPKALLPYLREISTSLSSPNLEALIKGLERHRLPPGRIMNLLMCVYRDTRSVAVFNLLFEFNYKPFLSLIFSRLKRYGSLNDPQDILQEVFISIYRYPRSFREEHENSFRNWSHSIIRNAIFKHMKRMTNFPHMGEIDNEIPDNEEGASPLVKLVEKERRYEAGRLYCFSLHLYLHLYNTLLTPREKVALHKVEVENLPYKEASRSMGIKLENFKMVVCRARKKIFYGSRKAKKESAVG